jgi:hypothetical protein
MARTLLIRGMLAGVAASVLAFVVAQVLGESQVGQAIAFESAHHTTAGGHDPELVSRTVQSTLGLFAGLLVFSVAIGGLYALAYACVQGRLGGLGARATAALVALGGFAGGYLLPYLKYPANPPSIGDPDTVGRRTALYFAMMAISLVVVVGAAVAGRRLAVRFGGWTAGLLAAAGGVLALGVAYAVLPGVHETPADFPADVLWRFRVASLAIQATVWATIGLLFGALTERSLDRSAPAPEDRSPARTGSPAATGG